MPLVIALALILPGSGTARAANGETFRALSPETSLTPLIQGESIAPQDHPAIVEEALQALDYNLDAVRDGFVEVPPVFLARVPADLNTLGWGETRKATFQKVLLPLILAVNADITEERARLLDLQARLTQGQPLTRLDQDWLARLADRYEIASPSPEALLIRVDAVPPSLALGQSALETGWGGARLVLETQNLFGHVGGGRFETLRDAVHAYVHNLNTHPQYEGFRLARSQARAEGEKTLDGDRLAATLRGYSTRGMAYVADLRALMRDNTMASLDGARLGRVTPRRWAQAW